MLSPTWASLLVVCISLREIAFLVNCRTDFNSAYGAHFWNLTLTSMNNHQELVWCFTSKLWSYQLLSYSSLCWSIILFMVLASSPSNAPYFSFFWLYLANCVGWEFLFGLGCSPRAYFTLLHCLFLLSRVRLEAMRIILNHSAKHDMEVGQSHSASSWPPLALLVIFISLSFLFQQSWDCICEQERSLVFWLFLWPGSREYTSTER